MSREELARENARLRGDLLTIAHRISHDLRTPLGGVIAASEALKEILADNEAAALVDSILGSTDEICKLIKRTSFITKASASPVAKEAVAMGLVVGGVLQQLESRSLKARATIIEPASWPKVNGVAAWLDAVWWNLLANALQHAGDAPKIELGWCVEERNFRFFVSDSGGGVAENKRAKLFQPFDSLHGSGSPHGLGLSLVQRLVELQGGVCGYESNPSGGACFFFILPAA